MQIFVKTPAGKVLTLKVKQEDSINTIKALIQNLDGALRAAQHLWLRTDGPDGTFKETELMDGQTLGYYEVEPLTTLRLVAWVQYVFNVNDFSFVLVV